MSKKQLLEMLRQRDQRIEELENETAEPIAPEPPAKSETKVADQAHREPASRTAPVREPQSEQVAANNPARRAKPEAG